MVKREYCFGIYIFTDNKTGNIVDIDKAVDTVRSIVAV